MEPIAKLIDLSGKTALVTGGAMGIGLGIATRLAEAGAHVAIVDMQKEAAEKAVATLTAEGRSAMAFIADVSQIVAVREAATRTVEAFGSLDILVNNAGIYPTIPVMNLTEEDFDRIVSINLKGAFLMTKVAAERMIASGKGGAIINITSVDAVHPSSVGLATYDATKHGLWGFTKNVALELAPHKIRVNAIAPGGITTPGTGAGKAPSAELQKIREAFEARIPMKHFGEPDDVGKVALFLASDMSSYMTGAQIVVDGGVLLS
jgi:2-deoxy-D-gluconate 3-dehydrogenase